MTRDELRAARELLGMTQDQLGAALGKGKHGGRTVRRWELGEIAVPGPIKVAIEGMLREKQQNEGER